MHQIGIHFECYVLVAPKHLSVYEGVRCLAHDKFDFVPCHNGLAHSCMHQLARLNSAIMQGTFAAFGCVCSLDTSLGTYKVVGVAMIRVFNALTIGGLSGYWTPLCNILSDSVPIRLVINM